jgi:mRNA interferase MazF
MGITLLRGDIVICAIQGDYGKPRPALIIQSNLFNATHSSFTLCPITSHLIEAPLFRITLSPTPENGLTTISQIMVDKLMSLQREKIKQKIGVINEEQLRSLSNALKIWLTVTE